MIKVVRWFMRSYMKIERDIAKVHAETDYFDVTTEELKPRTFAR
jgi:hypothetical protein